MADDLLQVELVAADQRVWSGEATFVLTRTTDGELGIMPHHAPVLSVLVEGVVVIRSDDSDAKVAAVDGGFLSVADNRVSILAEQAAMAEDIDESAARSDLEQAQGDDDDDDAAYRVRWAEARIAATEKG